jgi:hypothetical protein
MDPNGNIQSQLRHLGSLVAGVLITRGWIGAEYGEIVIGAIVALGMLVLAYLNKRKAQQVKAATVLVAKELPATTSEAQLNKVLAAQEPPLPPVNLELA